MLPFLGKFGNETGRKFFRVSTVSFVENSFPRRPRGLVGEAVAAVGAAVQPAEATEKDQSGRLPFNQPAGEFYFLNSGIP